MNNSFETDVLVVGAGVIGISIARRFAIAGQATLLVEAQSSYGAETSSRNSGVIHAGLYYPEGSLKERLCLAGKPLLYEYCRERHINHCQIGKLVVATTVEEVEILDKLYARSMSNGVETTLLSK